MALLRRMTAQGHTQALRIRSAPGTFSQPSNSIMV
jgi:hypothetical protein